MDIYLKSSLFDNMDTWSRFKAYNYVNIPLGFSMDISRMPFPDDYLASKESDIQAAYAAMAKLESGAIANPDENRMVGHYWLRNPNIAPNSALREEISGTLAEIKVFVAKVHSGEIKGSTGKIFTQLLVIGIGGSALGPQLVSHALGQPDKDKIKVHFLDNTDPDGIDYTLAELQGMLPETLVIVISKSGGTVETRNGQLEIKAAFSSAGLDYSKHFVAVTGKNSKLDQTAQNEKWLARFPMWDWVGGRTSELSAVGILPAALQGIDVDAILSGAAEMDVVTRSTKTAKNPAALLALMWYYATDGKGHKDMVILPYKDRLILLSRYLQQLIMESLGKELDIEGKIVNQGISVYGNKGSTDQHAYVQQLREGVNNFFVTFIEVLKDRTLNRSLEVEPGVTTGDYLQGFYLGTREALYEKDRHSITITVQEISPRALGQLIALYERATGFYATLVNINAYHQPGVEAGKKAASSIIALKLKIMACLTANPNKAFRAEEVAAAINASDKVEHCYKILEHLAANQLVKKSIKTPWFDSLYSV